jgi:protein required for attachment to host cells
VTQLVELLGALAHQYRHDQQEHVREAAASPTRRALEAKMGRTLARFERLLAHWIDDEAVREAWREHLRRGHPAPETPRLQTPPVFRGTDEAGSRVLVLPRADGAYDVVVDGTVEVHEAVPWQLDPDLIEPFRIGEHLCRERTEAPAEALAALARFLATPFAEPPWRWLRTLYDDGLVDPDFGLTPRGYRLLGRALPRPVGPALLRFGVVVADAARARMFVLAVDDPVSATVSPMVEVDQLTRPDRRGRPSELLSDTRPGQRREAPEGPRHAVSDRREHHRRALERRFAAEVAGEAERIWRAHGVTRVIVVASPAMLGSLRPLLARGGAKPWTVRELARDLTRLAPAALHDLLADDGLVPPRGRLPPLRPQAGAPI